MEPEVTFSDDTDYSEQASSDEYRRGIADAAKVVREYPAVEHGHLPTDPHAAAAQVASEIETAIRALSAEPAPSPSTYTAEQVKPLVEALRKARTDLMIVANNADDAAKRDPRWEGVGAKLRARNATIDEALKQFGD